MGLARTEDQNSDIERKIDALLIGAVDPHVHSGPSIAPRSIDHLELLKEASAAGFAAIVPKDHDYSTAIAVAMIVRHHPELTVKILPSIVLNNVVGGINPYAVEHTAALGGKIVWMPTLAAENHLRWEKSSNWAHPASTQKMRHATAIPVLNDDESVRDDVKEVLDVIAKNDMVLASGHLHVSETWKVFEEAKQRGVRSMVLTHPEDIVDASTNDVRGLASMGAYVEHSISFFIEGSKFKTRDGDDLQRLIDAAGVDQTVLCSDLGQTGAISPIEGIRRGIRLCIDLGYDDQQIRKMVSSNAARMLGLELAA